MILESSDKLPDFNDDALLNSFLSKEEIIRQTAQQIIKDFAEFGIEIQFSGQEDNAYQELFDQLNHHIEIILQGQFHRFFNLLYRIDINENEIYKSEARFPDKNKSEIISDLIIHRDLKKVLTRNYFKQQKKD